VRQVERKPHGRSEKKRWNKRVLRIREKRGSPGKKNGLEEISEPKEKKQRRGKEQHEAPRTRK